MAALLEPREAFAKGGKSVDLRRGMSDVPVPPEHLASALAARLIHDLVGPASGIVAAFDLVADPRLIGMRDEALAMAAATARDLVETMSLIRTIYGGGDAAFSTAELTAAARKLFTAPRADLSLRIDHPPTATSTRIFLALVQLMATAAAAGGTVNGVHTVAPEGIVIAFEGSGSRVRLSEEVYAGLAGRSPGAGKPHRWSVAYLVAAIARSTGGDVQTGAVSGGVTIRAVIRAEMA